MSASCVPTSIPGWAVVSWPLGGWGRKHGRYGWRKTVAEVILAANRVFATLARAPPYPQIGGAERVGKCSRVAPFGIFLPQGARP